MRLRKREDVLTQWTNGQFLTTALVVVFFHYLAISTTFTVSKYT